jgi:CHASE1-domain containing sensor protein
LTRSIPDALCRVLLDQNLLEADPANFRQRFVVIDETKFHRFTPDLEGQAKQQFTKWFASAEESKECFVSWKGYGLSFLGC